MLSTTLYLCFLPSRPPAPQPAGDKFGSTVTLGGPHPSPNVAPAELQIVARDMRCQFLAEMQDLVRQMAAQQYAHVQQLADQFAHQLHVQQQQHTQQLQALQVQRQHEIQDIILELSRAHRQQISDLLNSWW